jgi:hypothetical protein
VPYAAVGTPATGTDQRYPSPGGDESVAGPNTENEDIEVKVQIIMVADMKGCTKNDLGESIGDQLGELIDENVSGGDYCLEDDDGNEHNVEFNVQHVRIEPLDA